MTIKYWKTPSVTSDDNLVLLWPANLFISILRGIRTKTIATQTVCTTDHTFTSTFYPHSLFTWLYDFLMQGVFTINKMVPYHADPYLYMFMLEGTNSQPRHTWVHAGSASWLLLVVKSHLEAGENHVRFWHLNLHTSCTCTHLIIVLYGQVEHIFIADWIIVIVNNKLQLNWGVPELAYLHENLSLPTHLFSWKCCCYYPVSIYTKKHPPKWWCNTHRDTCWQKDCMGSLHTDLSQQPLFSALWPESRKKLISVHIYSPSTTKMNTEWN